MPFDNDNVAYYYPPVLAPTPYSFSIATQRCDCDGCRRSREGLRPPPAVGWPLDLPPMSHELRRVLTEARALVARGWGQGADKVPNHRFAAEGDPAFVYCARGAVREVIGRHVCDFEMERNALRHLARFTPVTGEWNRDLLTVDPEGAVMRFNDWETTRQADVVALFDQALA
jgi:hypothetical protein